MALRLLVSDVDGTLVRSDKSLAPATVAAAERLRAGGVQLALVSARPPFGMRHLVEPLRPDAFAAYNGGTIFSAEGKAVEEHLLPAEAGRMALAFFAEHNIDAWLFTADEWLITNDNAHYISLETHTVRQPPRRVPDLSPFLSQCGKIVGSTDDFALLARAESELQTALGDKAAARRSQTHYLDVTNRGADKGSALMSLCRNLGIAREETACIGDAPNDLPMFAVAGFRIAMGNAEASVKAQADAVTAGNDEDGFAQAVDRIMLPRATQG